MKNKKTGMCSCCREKPATHKVGNRGLCVECLQKNCPLCLAELTEKERVVIPSNGETRLSSQQMEENGYEVWKPCLKCFLKKLEKRKEYELRTITASFDFQLANQQCGRCGKLNDSRDDFGTVTARFCQSCRKAFGDDTAIRNITTREPRDVAEKPTIVFDKVVGFKHNE